MSLILVVEDDSSNAMLIEMCLTRDGHKVLCAVEGLGAVDTAESWHPDLVMLDVSLAGVMNGLEVCRLLRANPATADVGVLMVSGWAFDSDIEAARAAGADGYLSKPFTPPDLRACVEAVLAKADARRAAATG
jgi:CheY-like chemotaxis protein